MSKRKMVQNNLLCISIAAYFAAIEIHNKPKFSYRYETTTLLLMNAGALERLGAMLKSFENTLSEYPNSVTILVASCITDEVETRISASMSVRQKYITTQITSSESNQRKFANSVRKILKLT